MPFPSTSTYPGASTLPATPTAAVVPVNPNWPGVSVQVEFTPGTWTSLPNRVHRITTSRGRQYELAVVRAGTLNVTLENFDGAFDPTNTASPYYPNVKLMKRMRVMATWASVTYPIFTGYVERWPQRWGAAGNGQWTDLVAIDALGPLSQQVLEPVFYEQMKISSPSAWFPLDDPKGETVPNSRVSGIPAAKVVNDGNPNVTFGATPTAPGIAGASIATWAQNVVTTNNNNASVIALPPAAKLPATGAWTIFFAVNITQKASENQVLFCLSDPLLTQSLTMQVSSGATYVQFASGAPLGRAVPSESPTDGGYFYQESVLSLPSITDGLDHTVAVSRAADGVTFKVAVDGVLRDTFTTPSVYPLTASNFTVGGFTNTVLTGNRNTVLGSISQFATFNLDIIANLGVSGNTLTMLDSIYRFALYGQTTDARLTSVATYIPALKGVAPTVGSTGKSNMQNANLKGKTATQAILDPGLAENGLVYVSAAGAVTFSGRNARFNASPTLTFGENAGELHYQGVVEDYDLTRVFNRVTVTQPAPGGTVATAASASSDAAYGTRPLSVALDVSSAAQAIDAAAFLLGIYAEPVARIPAMTINPAADPSLWPAALGTELNTAIRVNRRPLAGAASGRVYWVESSDYSIDFSSGTFTVTWQLSPANINHYFTLGDATYGVLGATAGNFLAY